MPWSLSTSRARRKASTPAGTPAYTMIWTSVSRSSSSEHPLRSAPRKCVLNSSLRLSAGEDAQVVEAALLVAQRGTPPHLAPAVLGDELLELDVEGVGGVEGAVDVLVAEHTPARLEARVELGRVEFGWVHRRNVGRWTSHTPCRTTSRPTRCSPSSTPSAKRCAASTSSAAIRTTTCRCRWTTSCGPSPVRRVRGSSTPASGRSTPSAGTARCCAPRPTAWH